MTELPTVLVVAPDPDLRLLCEAVLEVEGYRVVTAEHADAAGDASNQQVPDVVLLDTTNLRSGERTALERMAADPRFDTVPVIVTSAAPDDDPWPRCVVEQVLEPFDPPSLARVVADVLDVDARGHRTRPDDGRD